MEYNEAVKEALRLLNMDGYFNDESSGLGTYCLKHNLQDLSALFRQHGYTGPDLGHAGHFYPERGPLYWVYNPAMMDRDEARILTDEWVAKKVAEP